MSVRQELEQSARNSYARAAEIMSDAEQASLYGTSYVRTLLHMADIALRLADLASQQDD